MTSTLSVLLCLGLCPGPWDQVQAAVPPKLSIWADPGPIVNKGSPVTIWCQGSLQVDGYILYKDRSSQPLDTRIQQASNNKTGFLIQSMSSQNTGLYQCAYSSGDRLSERSEPLLLVLTGEHRAPSLSAQPGRVVTSGGNVSLLCSSDSTWDTVHLLKEGGAEPPQHRKSERNYYERRWQAVFPVGPVSSSHGGTYRCYGSNSSNHNVWSQPSAPLRLEVTGVHREPSLSAQPGPLLLPGDNLTLQCHSEPGFDTFALTKDEGPTPPQHLHGQHSPDFPLGPVTLTHGGRYRCYSGHNLSSVWSAPSAPLDILIAGKYSKPSLSAQPGPSVPWGVNVTLQCASEVRADTFHLHREGSLEPPQQLHLQDTAAPSPANFTISPVTWGHSGTYRCYSSRSSSPFQLSQPSDPLYILIAGKYSKPSLSAQPGPSVPWGANVTLQCASEVRADTFHLHREGSLEPPQQLHLQDTAGPSQANFTISPVSWDHHGTYRCYSSNSSSPFQLSQPSDPLELLVSGLRWGPGDQVQAGVPHKPSIWADPGPIVSNKSSVTIWCQGSLQADGYILYKDRSSQPLDTRIPQASSNKTGFLIQSMGSQNTGLYQCAYSSGGTVFERSELLLLVLTGEHSAPSLSAQPGPVVTSGGNVSLLCSSDSTWDTVHLLKEKEVELPQHRKSEWNYYAGTSQAIFPVGPVGATHGGTYRCYGSNSSNPNVWSQPSAPLRLEVTGVHREPSLSAQPGPLLPPGYNLTLQCHSEPGFDRFALTKDGGPTPPQNLHGQHSPDFPLGPVTLTHGGQYRCYSGHNLSSVWSAPSAPLDILIAGKYSKPSLSAQPGPSVPWGANVTLQCASEVRADTFHLHREGSLEPPQQLHLQDTAAPSQANFTISPVTWGHSGTYRCYSSLSSSPFQLSQPSDPLELLVSAYQPQDYTVGNLIRLGVSGLILVVLGVLLCEAWHSQRRPHDATMN